MRMINLDQIESIFVEEAYRGNRIGDALMKNAIEWFDDNHVEVRKLYIVYGNDNVIGFY